MKWNHALIGFLALIALSVAGCKHKDEPNKIMDGVPANVSVEIVPGQAMQQWLLMQRDMVNIVVPAVNKFNTTVGWPELGTPDGTLHYTFMTSNSRYGHATFVIQFRDASGNPIPAVQASSQTLTSVNITGSATSATFTFNDAFNLRVQTFGASDSLMYLTGSTAIAGTGYALTLTLPDPGAKSVFQGLSAGAATVTGTGNGQPCTMNLHFEPSLDMNGTIAWEGNSGALRVNIDGTGFITTTQQRYFLR